MSLIADSWNFLGISTGREDRDVDREEQRMGENLQTESIYREMHPAIHQWHQSTPNVPMDLNFTPSNYRSPLAPSMHLLGDSAFPSLEPSPSIFQDDLSYFNTPPNDVQLPAGSSQAPSTTTEITSGQQSPVSYRAEIETRGEHPLYSRATTGSDGLYHCPWEADPSCNHKPESLKCNYDKMVGSHLKPYRCKVNNCENARFSSTACLLRHEREAHAMHGHGEKPFLCTFEACERGIPGNGFPRHWNLCDHMKRVHNRSPSPPSATQLQPSARGKRKHVHNTAAHAPHSKILSPAQKRFRDKAEELIAIIKKIENPDDRDAMKSLRAAEDCLKVLTDEIMKIKAGPQGLASRWDLESPD